MPSYSSLDPVSAAVYSTLNVSALTDLATGGVGDDIEQLNGYPAVLYEVQERNLGGLGSKPGTGKRVLEVDLRCHVFSTYSGFYEAQLVMNKIVELLANPPSVTGYSSPLIFHDDTVPLGDEIVAGVKVRELVGIWRLYVTEGS